MFNEVLVQPKSTSTPKGPAIIQPRYSKLRTKHYSNVDQTKEDDEKLLDALINAPTEPHNVSKTTEKSVEKQGKTDTEDLESWLDSVT